MDKTEKKGKEKVEKQNEIILKNKNYLKQICVIYTLIYDFKVTDRWRAAKTAID